MGRSVNTLENMVGFDPYVYAQRRQQLFNAPVAQAQNPYERMGAALGNIVGGTVFGLEDPNLKRASDINRIYSDVMAGTDPTKPDFADRLGALTSRLSEAGYGDAAMYAANQARTVKREEAADVRENTKLSIMLQELGIKTGQAVRQSEADERALLKFFKENPEQTGVALQNLATKIEQDPTNQVLLDKYNKIAQAGTSGSIEESNKLEKEALTLTSIKTTIAKNEADLKKIGTDFDAGRRWNAEREAALALFRANNLDPTQPLKGSALINTELVNKQTIALREPWTGGPAPAPGATPGPAAAPTSGASRVIDFNALPK
jgi:hypothetical protein